MEKLITDERTGLQYELVGDYYLLAGDEPEQPNIGVWGTRHYHHLRKANRVLFSQLMIGGKMNDYLAGIDKQAEDMFFRLVNGLAESEGMTEKLKEVDQMEWVRQMNSIRNRAAEIVNKELIFV